ncbi:pyridoxal phosphate-dependent transferase [Diaporthe sp. PMI_573]|nr:pyridoxal phosphate-dependent transferase [Diaporthaceae sp. PMI_573]
MPLSQWGVAAPCSSESFKTKNHKHKALAKDWSHRLSSESTSRTGSSLKGAFKHLENPGIISLGGGLPISEFFPFESLTFAVPSVRSTTGPRINGDHGSNKILAEKNDVSEGRSVYDISVALNYSQGSGSAQLLRWIVEHTEMHIRSALDMALRMLTKPGDCVLSDHFTFASAVETALPMGVKFVGIEMDCEGILPESLRANLENWKPEEHGNSQKPFLLYLIPTGQNPTGATQSLERRRDIYRVAQKHDLIILEDDPYYFLQMAPYDPSAEGCSHSEEFHSPADLLKVIVPSYVSIDVDGRVIRMDSFSKVVSPGSRIGWVTAPQEITERYKSHADVSTQGPSGFSQLALFKLLDEHWGHGGYLEWLVHIRKEYTKRRDFMVRACERHLPKGIVSWEPAQAGMFQLLRVDWRKYPDTASKSLSDIEKEIWRETIAQGALMARGSWFNAAKEKPTDEIFYRTTFAAAPLDKVEEAIRRFGEALRKSFQIN